MNDSEKSGFSYTYSAREQAELKKIREKYTEPTEAEDKMARLRRLDAVPTNAARTVALLFGVIGALILGFGMSLVMTEVGAFLGSPVTAMIVGISCGLFGAALAGLAYPMYQVVLKAKRKQLAPEILRLADELLK